MARRPGRVAAGLLLLLAGLSGLTLTATPAAAATDTVTNCSGSSSDAGSLPYEVANAASGDTINFSVSCPASSPIVLSSTVDIATSMTIDGPGANVLAVSGDGNVGVFQVDSGVTATISGLTIEDGHTYIGGGVDSSGTLTLTDCILLNNIASSGAIWSSGTLTVTGSIFSGNSAYSPDAGGGGIFNWYGMATISDSTLSDNNTDSNGGAIYNSGSLLITASTLSGNSATDAGGGIYNDNGRSTAISDSTLSGNSANHYGGGGILNNLEGTVTVTNSTIWDNSASNGAYAGGIRNVEGTVSLAATTVADNTPGGDCSGVTDAGYNIDDDGSCGLSLPSISHSTNLSSTLGPLANNGGPTETFLPELGSPTIGVIPPGTTANGSQLCPRSDQRGVSSFGNCTIGAVEGGFLIGTTSLPNAFPGVAYGPATLTTQEAGISTSPYKTSIKWTGIDLPTWLTLSSTGSLSGKPHKKQSLGTDSITVSATETVKTLNGATEVKTKTTVQATISLTVSAPAPLQVIPLISQYPTVTVGEDPYPPVSGQPSRCTASLSNEDFAQVVGGTGLIGASYSAPDIQFGGRYDPTVRVDGSDPTRLKFGDITGAALLVSGTPGGEAVQNTQITFTVTDTARTSASISIPVTIDNPDGIQGCTYFS